nr:retrovirus-related Pol polyprotein from transposon TNT 1-94 [Tanacetum cinerariifolium]
MIEKDISLSVTYACHLVNHLPSIAIDGKTPFEKVYGKPAIDYDSLHVLGFAAYYHVMELKLDPSAKKALFMQITSGIKEDCHERRNAVSLKESGMGVDQPPRREEVQIDVKTALLHGGLKEEIYMVQLEGFKVAGKVHEIKHLDEEKMILGMEIVRDRKLRKFCLTQKNIRVLKRFRFDKQTKRVSTPLASQFKISASMSPKNDAERAYMEKVPYANVVGLVFEYGNSQWVEGYCDSDYVEI